MSKYSSVFTDSTEHTAYTLRLTSENSETFTVELDDATVQEIIELLER